MSESIFHHLRSRFHLPDDKVYLDGNSLGALPTTTPAALANTVEQQWGSDLIASWNSHNWIELPLTVGDEIAHIIGAEKDTVVCCDNLSINLYKALLAALELNPSRRVVCVEDQQFPSDNYIAAGIARLLGEDRCAMRALSISDMTSDNLNDAAVLILSHVDYKTGSLRDMQKITEAAHQAGSLVIWDLAHSAGVIDIDIVKTDVDFAVGCTYKFLNGGPGAPGYLYVHKRHQSAANPIAGWMGHAAMFDFEAAYRPADGVRRFLTGTQSVLALSAVRSGLSIFENVPISLLRQRSLNLTGDFIRQLDARSFSVSVDLLTPRSDAKRGSQVSIALDDAFSISQALIDAGIIVDFRAPNIIRFGFSPLYNTKTDTTKALEALETIIDTRRFEAPEYQVRATVT